MKRRLKRIHVNQHVIRRNRAQGETAPPLTVKMGRENHKADRVEVYGPCSVVYRPDKPLDCGARVWIETRSIVAVELQGGRTYLDAH